MDLRRRTPGEQLGIVFFEVALFSPTLEDTIVNLQNLLKK
jgi:hypothetical protein